MHGLGFLRIISFIENGQLIAPEEGKDIEWNVLGTFIEAELPPFAVVSEILRSQVLTGLVTLVLCILKHLGKLAPDVSFLDLAIS